MLDNQPKPPIRYLYKFRFANGTEKDFEVLLDAQSLELVSEHRTPNPAWTTARLGRKSNTALWR